MQKKRHLSRFMQRVPIRWRLALVSLGLLVLLLSALGIIVSFIAEQALVTNEVNVLHNEAQVALKGVTKDLHQPQQRPFGLGINFLPSAAPDPGFDDTARSLLHALTSPSTSAVILTTTGTPLITNASSSFDAPGINIASSQVQQIIKSNVPYLLAKDNLGQHQLVVFIP